MWVGDWPFSSLLGLGLARDRLLLEADSLGSSWGKEEAVRSTLSTSERRGGVLYLGGLPAQQQVGGRDLVVLHLGQGVLDLLQVVAHPHHHVCTQTLLVSTHEPTTMDKSIINHNPLESVRDRSPSWTKAPRDGAGALISASHVNRFLVIKAKLL